MKTTTLYDFTLTAGGAQVILADANMYKVLTATGNISVTRDGGATIKPLRAGRGERNVAFTRLILRDLSGAPNSGTILVGDSDFIDDTIVLSSAINVRPESPSGSFVDTSTSVANTPIAVFTPASNTAGAIILAANFSEFAPAPGNPVFIAKASAPVSISDGQIVCGVTSRSANASNEFITGNLSIPQFVSAGLGLYWITNAAVVSSVETIRSARYKLL